MRERADRAGYFAHAHLFGRRLKTFRLPRQFIPPQRYLQAESNRLGMHAVGAANLYGVLVFESQFAQRRQQSIQIFRYDGRAFLIWSACAVSTTSFEVRP